jgi:hypothetical protein
MLKEKGTRNATKPFEVLEEELLILAQNQAPAAFGALIISRPRWSSQWAFSQL